MSFYGAALLLTALTSAYFAACAYSQLSGVGAVEVLPYKVGATMLLRTAQLSSNSIYSIISESMDGINVSAANGAVVARNPLGMYCVSMH